MVENTQRSDIRLEKIRQHLIIIVGLITFSLSACAPKLTVAEYGQGILDSKTCSHDLPQYVIDKKKPKIGVLPPSNATQFKGKCDLSQSASETFTQTLAKIGTVEVVERGQLDVFMQEIKFQAGISGEIDTDKFMQIAKGVDFVFVGSVSTARVSAKFTEGGQRKNIFTGKYYYANPTCSESAEVLVNYRLLALPSGNVQQAFQMDGQKSTLPRDVSESTDCKVQNPCGLLQEAVYRAVDNAKESLAETFPAYGYVYKTMNHGKKQKNRIAFISLGKADGIEAGNIVDIIEFVKEKDPIKNTLLFVPRLVTECTVAETELFADRSICIIQEDNSDAVFVKHAVKTKVNTSAGRSLQKLYRLAF